MVISMVLSFSVGILWSLYDHFMPTIGAYYGHIRNISTCLRFSKPYLLFSSKAFHQIADAVHIQIITKTTDIDADMDADFYRQMTGKPIQAKGDINIWMPVLDESKLNFSHW